MFSVNEYSNAIKSSLEKRSDMLVNNLEKVFANKFSTDIDLLEFTVFIEPTTFEFSIMMFSMDKHANEVFAVENDPELFAGSIEVLTEVTYHQVDDSQLDDFFDFYEENEERVVPQEQNVFAEWFKACWEEAGGQTLPIPAFFIFHDDSQSLDLKDNKWIDDDEKWC